MSDFCSKVITFPQFNGTCWFNALLMTILYSQNSRKLLLKVSKKWDMRLNILKIFKDILSKKYIKTNNIDKDYDYFNMISPDYILDNLHSYKPTKFLNFNKFDTKGFNSILYIKKLYKLFGVSALMFDINNNKIFYSKYNKIKGLGKKDNKIVGTVNILSETYIKNKLLKNKNPDIIILNEETSKQLKYKEYYNIKENQKELLSSNNEIIYNDNIYILDSVILSNWNETKSNHVVAGITCKKDRYIYNGWSLHTIDPSKNKIMNNKIPCELMKYKWDIKNDKDFCLNPIKCIPDFINIKNKEDLCFSFNKKPKILVYILKNKIDNSASNDKNEIDKVCPDDKILNPITNRCNKIKKIVKKEIKKVVKKLCPDGKILNPITNRCNKIKEIKKVCPDDKILNPITNRCNKIKIKK